MSNVHLFLPPQCSHRPAFRGITRASSSRVSPSSYELAKYAQTKIGKRGGQNLTNRDLRLAKSVRQKHAFLKAGQPEAFAVDSSSITSVSGKSVQVPVKPKQTVETFKGLLIPSKPAPPASDECCMSGCAICIYDLYLGSLEEYREKLESVRAELISQHVPTSKWPSDLKDKTEETAQTPGQDPLPELDVNLAAFVALEKSLREKSTARMIPPSSC